MNTTKLLPSAADVYLIYKCPRCAITHTITRAETVSPGKILCPCGESFALKPIREINVQPVYEPEASPKVSKEAVGHSWDDAVKALEGYGYKRSKVFGKVMSLYLKDKTVSSDELLQQFFSRYV